MKKYYAYILETYYALSAALVIFLAMEIMKTGLVSAYINLNIILIFWVLSGILVLYSKR